MLLWQRELMPICSTSVKLRVRASDLLHASCIEKL